MTTPPSPAAPDTFEGYGTPSYRKYVLFILFVVYTFNFIDRTLLMYVQEPIKQEFHLSDFQLGILGGATFAILYTLLGIPIARLAERKSRITIISVAVAVWSLMSAACGLATSFATLLAARVGVGVGEAGGTPPSQSAISDYFPVKSRATAIAFYSMGVPIGVMIAGFGGGWIGDVLGWRAAFIAVGLPGLIVAALVRFTVKEPPRTIADAAPPFAAAFREIAGKATFWWVSLGSAGAAFVGYGIGQYYTSYFVRSHHLSITDASRVVALIVGLGGGFSVLFGGWLSDKISHRHPNTLAWIGMLGFLITTPAAVMTFRSDNLAVAMTFAMIALSTQYLYLGGQYSITQGVVHPKSRATAVAVMLFIVNVIGYVFGPPVTGAVSDHFNSVYLASNGQSLEACKAMASDPVCMAGAAHGLKTAAQIIALVFLPSAACFAMAWRTMQKDWWRPGRQD